MSADAHLWAIGYEDVAGAGRLRDEIFGLGWGEGLAAKYLVLLDVAVAVRQADGSFVLDHQPFPAVSNVPGGSVAGFFAGLVLGTPLTGAGLGALFGGMGSAVAAAALGIADGFIQEVKGLMKPGTSVLFVLDDEGDLEIVLHSIQGFGGTVVNTNVDRERAAQIQAALSADLPEASRNQVRSVPTS